MTNVFQLFKLVWFQLLRIKLFWCQIKTTGVQEIESIAKWSWNSISWLFPIKTSTNTLIVKKPKKKINWNIKLLSDFVTLKRSLKQTIYFAQLNDRFQNLIEKSYLMSEVEKKRIRFVLSFRMPFDDFHRLVGELNK